MPLKNNSVFARLYLLIAIALLLSIAAHGQDYRYQQAVNYYNQGELQAAFDLAVVLKTEAEENEPLGSFSQFQAVQLIALIMTQAAAYEQCEILLKDYLPVWEYDTIASLLLQYCAIENYRLWGRSADALSIAEEALSTYQQMGLTSLDYYNVLNSYGLLCFNFGRYRDAEIAFLACKEFYGNYLMIYEEQYQRQNNNLGLLYTSWNRLQEAESLLKDCLAYRKIVHGENSPLVATTLNNLAAVYLSEFNYRKAYQTYERAYYIRASLYGRKHSLTIQCVNNMATAAIAYEDYSLADSLMVIAVNEWRKSLGEESSDYLTALNTFATLKMQFNELDTARILLQQIYAARKNMFGDHSIILRESLGALTELEYRSKNFDFAAKHALANYEICSEYFGKNTSEAFDYLLDAALAFEKAGSKTQADSLVEQWYNNALLDLSVFIGAESGDANSIFLGARQSKFSAAAAFTKRNHARNYSLIATTLNAEINFRNWQLYSLSKWNELIASQKNEALNLQYAEWKMLREEYGNMLQYGGQNLDEKNQLKNEIAELEVQIKQSIPNSNLLFTSTSYTEIAKNLNPNQIALQILYQADYDEFKNALVSRTYESILINNAGELSWITLCDADKIENWYETTATFTDRSWAYRGAEDLSEQAAEDTTSTKLLTRLVWEPLKPYLKNVNELIYAPDGVFGQISLSSIPTTDTNFVIDSYSLLPVTSLLNLNDKPKNYGNKSFLLYGGIDYENEFSSTTNKNVTLDKEIIRTDTSEGFAYLVGTKKELNELSSLLERKKIDAIVRSGKFCTEAQFYADVAQQPRIIHLATHGFYISKKNQYKLDYLEITVDASNKFELARDPFMRSGLILAGGNLTWNNQNENNDAATDGVLTSFDFSKLDLTNTELVMLSACETALGDITYGQGIFGLQTAIKRSGGKYLIIALWKISDEATVEFVAKFYENWLSDQAIESAFTYAQKFMRKKYPPYIWGAFQLVH